jgi:hypothetical protein
MEFLLINVFWLLRISYPLISYIVTNFHTFKIECWKQKFIFNNHKPQCSLINKIAQRLIYEVIEWFEQETLINVQYDLLCRLIFLEILTWAHVEPVCLPDKGYTACEFNMEKAI